MTPELIIQRPQTLRAIIVYVDIILCISHSRNEEIVISSPIII